MKIAFDYDFTLSQPLFQELASNLMDVGHDIYVLTKRTDNYEDYLAHWIVDKFHQTKEGFNKDLFEVTDRLNIPRHKIIFTKYKSKIDFYKKFKFDILFDDEKENVDELNANNCPTILVSEYGKRPW